MKKPSAWIPVALSAFALITMLIYLATLDTPPVREADEGIGAHLFQIWLVLEALMITFFATKWLPRAPKDALIILAVQIIAVLGACSPVFYFGL